MNNANAYSILDTKSKIYNNPHFLINDAVAIRQFGLIVNDKESIISKYPEDFRLYRVGTFDMSTGKITSEQNPVEIAHGLNLKSQEV
ncbi:MAG: nonstructural protein [Arizlama microvirus]|nr:MAG: nonstructural protein [Arizlama microvirus]